MAIRPEADAKLRAGFQRHTDRQASQTLPAFPNHRRDHRDLRGEASSARVITASERGPAAGPAARVPGR